MMNKFFGVIVVLALIVAGVYFGVRFATASKAEAILAQYLQGFDNWSVENAYFNPLTGKVVANGFKLGVDEETELTVGSVEVSGFNQSGDELSGAVSFSDIRLAASGGDDSAELSVKSFSASDIVLDRSAVENLRTKPEAYQNPIKKLGGFKLEGFDFLISGKKFMSLESIAGNADYIADGKLLPYPASSEALSKNLVFYSQDGKKEYRVERTNSVSTYKGGVYQQKIDADSKELFNLSLEYSLGGIENIPLNADAESFDYFSDVTVNGFALNYTERTLIGVLLDAFAKDREATRDEVIDMIEGLGGLFLAQIKNSDLLQKDLIGFLKDPKTLTIKAAPAAPLSITAIGEDINKLALSLSFNGGEPFLIQVEGGQYGYEDDYYGE
jgi:hypothetical protein